MDALVAAAEAAADVAGAVIRPFFRAHLPATLKHDRSPVTIADRTAEQAMRAVLAERYPDHGIMGEEFGTDRADARLRWVLDPIDGTRAFITGRPVFGTLIALLDDGVPILGVIDQPVTGERWVGVGGRPTRFRGPFGGAAGTRPCAELAAAELSATSPEMLGPHRPAWDLLAGAVRRVSWGGDCYAYGLLALGQIDVIAEADLKPWDWAALVPVIEGAGGRITDWAGQTLRVDLSEAALRGDSSEMPLRGNSSEVALRAGGDGRVLAVGDPTLLAPAVARLGGR